ncbi:DNA repair protein REV1 [Arthroderma uncinatum]|uniref:DNA repair protein REV1 n=1 Tax=Arthroderma uncinatum TaxID=74035 RepID=UPI00144AD0A3|nr:DNA repair protein REV1 [Arthroderma uncinatum]KAF3480407.1 DNA repair protein REV1 [Arthroderma uncinatum]
MGSKLEAGSNATRKRIENHEFTGEDGEEYDASGFGGFGDYFRRKKIKLQNLDAEIRSASPNNPAIFKGIVAHVNGYTQPSLNDLHRMIVSHGGGYLQYLDGKTAATHIIASALTPKKREEFRQYRIVKPAWVVESVKAGRMLPWESFRLLDEGASQKILKFDTSGKISAETNTQSQSYRSQTESSWYTSQLRNETAAADTPKEAGASADKTGVAEEPSLIEEQATEAQSTSIEHSNSPPKTPENHGTLDSNDTLPTVQPELSLAKQDPDVRDQDIKDPESDGKQLTPEEHNAILLSKPHIKQYSVVNPDFIQQYYRESRLHHLSTWKAELKAQLQNIAQERGTPRRTPTKRPPGTRRYILHVDFDSFFAAVSLQKHPELAEKPVAIAHGTGPGSEIASCNYPARKFGVKNGMWMKGALELCPELKVLPYDFPAYEDASRKFYDAILDIDGVVQSVSIDEALVDISSLCIEAGGSDGKAMPEASIYREQDKADITAQNLRDSIKEKTGCNISVGIGQNILQAKLALRKAKPAGQFQIKPDDMLDFIGEFTVKDLPGVAHSLGAKLEEIGVKYVKDIRQLSREKLTGHLGPKTGAKLWEYSRGIDNAVVGEQVIRKSVSAEINWGIRFTNQTQADEFVQSLCEELHRRLLENGVKGSQLTMRIMRRAADSPVDPPKHLGHGKCDTFNKSVALHTPTNSSDVVGKEAISILHSFNFSPGDLRGLGVQMTKLTPIKATFSGELASSQRQLQFKRSSPSSRNKEPQDPDEIISPKKGENLSPHISGSLKAGPSLNDMSQKPLNLTGTQFILPSQPNSSVLAELPGEVRSKLVARERPSISEQLRAAASSQRVNSPFASTALPPESQLDQETLNALPEDVRAEVLGYYRQNANTPGAPPSSSAGLQKSPRHKKPTTPTKPRPGRGRGRPRAAAKSSTGPTLIQSSFITSQPSIPSYKDASTAETPTRLESTEPDSEISADFLAALPEDIRQEVLEEHRQARLRDQGGLNLAEIHERNNRARQDKSNDSADPVDPEQKFLRLDPRPAKPTFTSKKLSALPELREALNEWYSSFETEVPYEEDVEALTKYLRRVVLEEKDISKATDLARWLGWLVNDSNSNGGNSVSDAGDKDRPSIAGWKNAVIKVQNSSSESSYYGHQFYRPFAGRDIKEHARCLTGFVTNTEAAPTHYAVILYEGFQALDVFGPLDALNITSLDNGIKLSIIGPSLGPVSTKPPPLPTVTLKPGWGFSESVVPTHSYADPPTDIDVLVVPGGLGTNDASNIEPAIQLTRKLYPSVKYLFSICTGAKILAAAGLLDGKKATTNKRSFDASTKPYPQVQWQRSARWVVDGNIWTSSGISAGTDAMISFIGTVYGREFALSVAKRMEYRWVEDPADDPWAAPEPSS